MLRLLLNSTVPVVMLLCLGGCASAPPAQETQPSPQPEAHVLATQGKALAAQHWGAIAADIAARTKQTLAANNFLDGRALYVAPSKSVAFDQAFSNFMITALVEAGLPVSTQSEGTVEIRYETQMIQHKVDFDPRQKGYVPGAPGTVEAGFWVQRNTAVSGAADARRDAQSPHRMWPTSLEMVVTTSIIEMDQFVQRTTDAYYIEQADASLFKNERAYREWKVAPQ